jgi:DNA (cytosine-5)-methyltransferase 1
MTDLTFYEFFAGGGMARLGLGRDWNCLFANDFDPTKAETYRRNFSGGDELALRDIRGIRAEELPGHASLAWASFPCQDLSLAGNGAGLSADRSGMFWPFWNLIQQLGLRSRGPAVVVLENVYGALTSRGGKDFETICKTLSAGGYRFGPLVLDAVHFVPQSRPRLFVVAVRDDLHIPSKLTLSEPDELWHVPAIQDAYERFGKRSDSRWVWWNVGHPKPRRTIFSDLIEEIPTGVKWHTPAETRRLLGMMSDRNRAKVNTARQLKRVVVGALYRRTRLDTLGNKVQRAEVRFDDIAGCLRTPRGGSSRQSILVVNGKHIKSRLLSPREAARLMGLPDSYCLPENYNAAYHVAGDGVVVPVVRHLARTLLAPLVLLSSQPRLRTGAAA